MSGAVSPAGFESVWTRSADGLRLHARRYGPGTSGRLPVVCLPGLTRNSSEFDPIARALLADGAADRIVAVDYRGRGLSDHDPDPGHYTIPVETADLLGLLADLGIEAGIFLGVSRGGLISMGLGAHRPDLVRAILLNDIGPVLDRPGLLRIKSYVGKFGVPADLDDGAAKLKAQHGRFFPNLTPDEWRAWAATVWTERGGELVLAYDPALAHALGDIGPDTPIPDLWQTFDTLGAIPILELHGGLSDLTSAETVAEMARRHPRLETITVADEGHTPFMHRPAIAARIAAFIRSVPGG